MASLDALSTLITRNVAPGVTAVGALRVPFYFGSEKQVGIDVVSQIMKVESSLAASSDISGLLRQLVSKMTRMWINPTNMTLSQTKRIEELKTYGGVAFMFWIDQNGFANDPAKIVFSGTTGNINPGSPLGKQKLYQYLKLRDLSAEKRVWIDPAGQMHTNHALVLMQSMAIPFAVLFVGFFNPVMTIVDTADDPYQKLWTLNMVAEYVWPPLERLADWVTSSLLDQEYVSRLVGDIPVLGEISGPGTTMQHLY